MNPRRRSTDLDRRQPGLLKLALLIVLGWLAIAAAAFGLLP